MCNWYGIYERYMNWSFMYIPVNCCPPSSLRGARYWCCPPKLTNCVANSTYIPILSFTSIWHNEGLYGIWMTRFVKRNCHVFSLLEYFANPISCPDLDVWCTVQVKTMTVQCILAHFFIFPVSTEFYPLALQNTPSSQVCSLVVFELIHILVLG